MGRLEVRPSAVTPLIRESLAKVEQIGRVGEKGRVEYGAPLRP